MSLSAEQIETMFTRPDGSFLCARWGRGIAPVVFGVEDATVSLFKSALQLVCGIAGHEVVETDPELGVNLMVFFLRDWAELREVPDLEKMVPGRDALADRLEADGAGSHRELRFDASGAIQAGVVFLRMDDAMADVPADLLALVEAVRIMLSWAPGAFGSVPLTAEEAGQTVLNPDILTLMKTAYDPFLPAAARDSSHALRLSARLETLT